MGFCVFFFNRLMVFDQICYKILEPKYFKSTWLNKRIEVTAADNRLTSYRNGQRQQPALSTADTTRHVLITLPHRPLSAGGDSVYRSITNHWFDRMGNTWDEKKWITLSPAASPNHSDKCHERKSSRDDNGRGPPRFNPAVLRQLPTLSKTWKVSGAVSGTKEQKRGRQNRASALRSV